MEYIPDASLYIVVIISSKILIKYTKNLYVVRALYRNEKLLSELSTFEYLSERMNIGSDLKNMSNTIGNYNLCRPSCIDMYKRIGEFCRKL